MNTSLIHIPQHGNGTNKQYKTSLCRHYEYGNCSIGDKCQFAHGLAQLRKYNDPLPNHVPQIEANLVITNFKSNQFLFQHYQAVICKYNESGFCKNGISCPYAHAQITKGALQAQSNCKEEEKEKANKQQQKLQAEPDNKLKSNTATLFLLNFVKELREIEFENKEGLQCGLPEIISLANGNNHKLAIEKIVSLMKSGSDFEKYQYSLVYQKFLNLNQKNDCLSC